MNEHDDSQQEAIRSGLSRRNFIKTSALLGGSALAASQAPWLLTRQTAEAGYLTPTDEYQLAKPENIIYTVCQQCNTQCGIKVKLQDGVVVKADGNPLSPWTMRPHLPYATSPFETATIDGSICPKGQAGLQTGADPYRIVRVVKRAGPRGSGKWASITFDQAIDEIVNGGKLFAGVPGEEEREVTGLKDIWALHDPKVHASKAAGTIRTKVKTETSL